MNPHELFSGHVGLAYHHAAKWRLPGADQDDVRQEALLALHVAALDYQASAGVPFPAFASIVIRRRLASAVTAANRSKHQLLTTADRVVRLGDGHLAEATLLIPDPRGDTHEQAERRQHVQDVIHAINHKLTPLERAAVLHLANGGHITSKRIDNAACKARRKLRAA